MALVAVLAGVLAGLRLRPGQDEDDRLLVLGAGAGLVALVASAVTFDTFTAGSSRLFWLLAGIGLAAAERTGAVPVRRTARTVLSPARGALLVALFAVGVLVRLAVPTHAATEAVFSTLAPATEAFDDPPGLGRTLVSTFCALAEQSATAEGGEVTRCVEKGPPGWGVLRVQAAGPLTADRGVERAFRTADDVTALRFLRGSTTADSPAVGRASAVQAAPGAAAVLALSALLLPPRRRRD